MKGLGSCDHKLPHYGEICITIKTKIVIIIIIIIIIMSKMAINFHSSLLQMREKPMVCNSLFHHKNLEFRIHDIFGGENLASCLAR